MHEFVFCRLSTKTAINIIEYSIAKIIFCLSILVRLAKKCFRGVTIQDIGMRDKRHHVSFVYTAKTTRSDQAL